MKPASCFRDLASIRNRQKRLQQNRRYAVDIHNDDFRTRLLVVLLAKSTNVVLCSRQQIQFRWYLHHCNESDIPPNQSYDLNGRTQRKGQSRSQAPQHPLVCKQRPCQPASGPEIPDSVVQPIPEQSPDERVVTAKPDISLALQEIPVQTPYQW